MARAGTSVPGGPDAGWRSKRDDPLHFAAQNAALPCPGAAMNHMLTIVATSFLLLASSPARAQPQSTAPTAAEVWDLTRLFPQFFEVTLH